MTDLETARRCAAAMMASDHASKTLGITIDIDTPGEACARMRVREDMVNGFNVCHGGLVFALADSAFAFACNAHNRVTVAAAASIEFLRPVMVGDDLTATAVEDHRGRRAGFYTVRVVNQDDALVALFHGRSASRDETILEV
jgi:acyl-CoA thioesterase